MKINTLYIDLDDTVYPASAGVWQAIRQRIDSFICERFELPLEEAVFLRDDLFHKYGTTMRGLQVVYHLDEEDYLSYVHDVPLKDFIRPNPALGALLAEMPYRKAILTNADTAHARRVLSLLEIENCFEQIIDIRAIAPFCKPMPDAFNIALKLMDERATNCAVVEDSTKNLITAKKLGFYTVRVGGDPACVECDACIDSIMGLREVFAEMEI